MVITAIEACKKSKNRFNIYSLDGFVCALFYDLISEYRLKVGVDIKRELLEKIAYEDDCMKCYQKACALLSMRSRSKGEIISKLKEKGYGSRVIDHTIRMLEERKYLDDDSFAGEYAEYLQSKGYGEYVIKQKLYEKGVDKELAAQAVEELCDQDSAAMEYGAKAYVRACREDDLYKRKNKFLAAMARHGFGYDMARTVYGRLSQGEEND